MELVETSGWVWRPISGLTMARLALPTSPNSTTRQASTGNHSGGKRPPGSPSWSINAHGGTGSPNPMTAIPSSVPSLEGLSHAGPPLFEADSPGFCSGAL